MKVYQRLAQAFKAEGTEAVFGIMGDANMYWYSELDKLGVELVEVRHEGAGLGMADGWARATHKPGIASATCGPGTTQLATAFVVAARAESPLVAFCGEHPTNDDGYNQRFDNRGFAAVCETGFVRLNSPESVDDVVRKAFYTAQLESKPVMLSCPMDIQQKNFEDDDEYQTLATILPKRASGPDGESVKRAVDLISGAKRPVIVAGRGARWSGAGEAILEARGPQRRAARDLAHGEDVARGQGPVPHRRLGPVCDEDGDHSAAGSRRGHRRGREPQPLHDRARIPLSEREVRPHRYEAPRAHGQRTFVRRLRPERCEARRRSDYGRSRTAEFKQTGYRTDEVKKQLVGHLADRAEFPIEDGKVDPRDVVTTLDEVVPGTISLLTGSGASAGFSNILFAKERPLVMASHFFGCIGQMMPAAMGAVLASGNKPHVLVDGDASVMMHLAEFDTMMRHKMPLLIVVLNNEALGSEYYKLDAHKMDKELSVIPTPDLGAVARGFGGKGALVTKIEDLQKAAQEWVANPCPMIIDARIERAVVTLPYRRIHYGRDE